MESWKKYMDSNYEISNFGKVRNLTTQKILQGINIGNGYLSVNIHGKRILVHRLVALCFLDNPENKSCVDHINRTRNDNRVENLRWVTHSENMHNVEHKNYYIKHLKHKHGEKIYEYYQVSKHDYDKKKYLKIFKTLIDAENYITTLQNE